MAILTWRSTWPAVLAIWLGACMVGCEPGGMAGPEGDALPPTPRSVGLEDAAGQLGLAVAYRSRTSATLRDTLNTVVLYAEPLGEAYVNGRPLSDSGGIEAAADTLVLPASLVARIGTQLTPAESPVAPTFTSTPPPFRQPERLSEIGRVVIDPGHGGRDPGATSVVGFHEKDLVLDVARQIEEELKARGAVVRLTRSGDRYLELEERPAVANLWKADAFASIHADSAENRSASGLTVYVSRSPDRQSLHLANAVLKHAALARVPTRGVRQANYRVLVHANVPAVLIELGFLSNRFEAARLGTQPYQQQVARAVAAGIAEFVSRK